MTVRGLSIAEVDAMNEKEWKTKRVNEKILRNHIKESQVLQNRILHVYYKELLKHNSINCSSVLIQTEVAKEFPMHHEDSHEDYIMWLEILKKYGKACAVNEPLLKYRLSNKGKSGSKLNSAKMTFKVYRYMGFGMIQSLVCFVSYAFNGVWKYYFGKNGE